MQEDDFSKNDQVLVRLVDDTLDELNGHVAKWKRLTGDKLKNSKKHSTPALIRLAIFKLLHDVDQRGLEAVLIEYEAIKDSY